MKKRITKGKRSEYREKKEPENIGGLSKDIIEISSVRKRKILVSTAIFIIFFLLVYGILAITRHKNILAFFDFSSALLMLISLLFYIKKGSYAFSRNIMVSIMFLVFIYLFIGEGVDVGSYLWTLAFPIYTIFFLGTAYGFYTSLLFLVVEISIYISGIFQIEFGPQFMIRYSGVYIAIFMISYIIEKIREENITKLLLTNSRLNDTVRRFSKAQKALSASEKKYRNLVERGNDGIVIVQNEKIVYSNPQFCRMIGITERKLKKLGIPGIIPKNDYNDFIKFLSDGSKEVKSTQTFETVLTDSKKVKIDVEIKKTSLDYPDSKADLLFIRDISLRRMFERERIKSSKMDTFRVVSDGITHDFNNLLTIVMGNVELAKLNISNVKKLKKNLAKIEDAADRSEKLIKQFLTFSSDATLVLSKEYIQDLIPDVINSFNMKKIKFDLKIPDSLWPVRCDRDRIKIALSNIISNGSEAMDNSGAITIECENVKKEKKDKTKLKSSPFVLIKIIDSGKGIPPENIEKIFDPYFSTKKSVTQKGMGLGLTIANRVILNHNGILNVESAMGKGTTFSIYLPAEPEKMSG